MGHKTKAKCKDCGRRFTAIHGGGFTFHLLRCTTCGKTKSVLFDSLGSLHVRYLKGLPGAYCVATAGRDAAMKACRSLRPLDESAYRKEVESEAGTCGCGGELSFSAPLRCPKCRSLNVTEGDIVSFYD